MPEILNNSPDVKIQHSGDFTDVADPNLHNLNNIDNDLYNQKLSTAQSMSVGAYELANFIPNDCGQKKARNIQTSQVGINFNAGHEGGKNGCLIDPSSYLRFEDMTNKNVINQLSERLTLTTPYIRGLYDVDVESVLMPGEKTDLKRPCNVLTGKSEVTSQNHGFSINHEDVKNNPNIEITHINLNDDTVEGISLKHKNCFSVQYHPESSPGPYDSRYLFDEFVERMMKHKKNG